MMSSTNKLSEQQSIPYMSQVDNLPTDSQPDLTKTIDVSLSISYVHNVINFEYRNVKSFIFKL